MTSQSEVLKCFFFCCRPPGLPNETSAFIHINVSQCCFKSYRYHKNSLEYWFWCDSEYLDMVRQHVIGNMFSWLICQRTIPWGSADVPLTLSGILQSGKQTWKSTRSIFPPDIISLPPCQPLQHSAVPIQYSILFMHKPQRTRDRQSVRYMHVKAAECETHLIICSKWWGTECVWYYYTKC